VTVDWLTQTAGIGVVHDSRRAPGHALRALLSLIDLAVGAHRSPDQFLAVRDGLFSRGSLRIRAESKSARTPALN
jgi:hypothetical protein